MNVASQPILLVEDDENDVMLLQRAFRRAAIVNPLQVVRHGDDAVAYIEGTGEFADRQQHPLPVLMLLDLKLPRRTGLEVLQWVKERQGLKKIPIIVLSSSKNDDDINRRVRTRREFVRGEAGVVRDAARTREVARALLARVERTSERVLIAAGEPA